MKRSLGREVHGAVRSSRKTATSSLSLGLVGSSGRVSSVFRLFPFPPKSLLYAVSTEALVCTLFSASVLVTSQGVLCGMLPQALNTGALEPLEWAEHREHRHSSLGREMGEHCKGSWWQ